MKKQKGKVRLTPDKKEKAMAFLRHTFKEGDRFFQQSEEEQLKEVHRFLHKKS